MNMLPTSPEIDAVFTLIMKTELEITKAETTMTCTPLTDTEAWNSTITAMNRANHLRAYNSGLQAAFHALCTIKQLPPAVVEHQARYSNAGDGELSSLYVVE